MIIHAGLMSSGHDSVHSVVQPVLENAGAGPSSLIRPRLRLGKAPDIATAILQRDFVDLPAALALMQES